MGTRDVLYDRRFNFASSCWYRCLSASLRSSYFWMNKPSNNKRRRSDENKTRREIADTMAPGALHLRELSISLQWVLLSLESRPVCQPRVTENKRSRYTIEEGQPEKKSQESFWPSDAARQRRKCMLMLVVETGTRSHRTKEERGEENMRQKHAKRSKQEKLVNRSSRQVKEKKIEVKRESEGIPGRVGPSLSSCCSAWLCEDER